MKSVRARLAITLPEGVNLMQEQNNEKNTQGADRRPGPLDGLLVGDFGEQR